VSDQGPSAARLSRLVRIYAAEAVGSVSGTLLTVGLPFYTQTRFGWGARENFLVATCQGVGYVLGALSAGRIAGRWGRRSSLVVLFVVMMLLGAGAATCAVKGLVLAVVALVVGTSFVMAMTWPMLESLVASDGEPQKMSRRLGVYNVVWAVTGSIALAGSGAVIEHAPPWAFLSLIAACHAIAACLVLSVAREADDASPVVSTAAAAEAPEPELVRQRTVALWLSRIALPATYLIIYGLAPALPSLPAVERLTPTVATVVASAWLAARAATFVVTAHTKFWHTRPSLLFWAAVLMLAAFLGTVLAPSSRGLGLAPAILLMVIAEVFLGIAVGMIYSGSLYFGMVLSEGSTKHGGYHEALIGLGQIMGPAMGASMAVLYPGQLWPGIGAISGLVALTVALAAVAKARAARPGAVGTGTGASAV
jgi:MFS family permease